PYADHVPHPIAGRACRRRCRRPRGARRGAACAILTAAFVFLLAACGSSSSSTKSVTGSEATSSTETGAEHQPRASANGSTAGATRQTAQSSVHVPGCRSVPAPASRAGEQASKNTVLLDPARTYTVQLATNCGPIVIQIAVKEAPKTASSFAHLVKLGYYNGLTFHRVVRGFVIQGGDPNGDGTGGPSWA